MRPSEIVVGGTYCNRGAGRTTRTVLDIGTHIKPTVWSSRDTDGEVVVLYEQNGTQNSLLMSSFAGWCGKRVK